LLSTAFSQLNLSSNLGLPDSIQIISFQFKLIILVFNTTNFEVKVMPRNTSVTLGEHFDKFVVEKINEGRFQSVSEVVRAGLRKLEEDEAKLNALRRKLQAGENSHLVENFDGEDFLAAMHKKHIK
jgi:antitoxin ParD1/3/4